MEIPVRTTFPVGGLAVTPSPAHHPPCLDLLTDPGHRIRLEIEVTMGLALDSEAFFLAARVNPNDDGLCLPCGRLDVQPDTPDPLVPERRRFACLHPPPRSTGNGRHQRLIVTVYNGHKNHDKSPVARLKAYVLLFDIASPIGSVDLRSIHRVVRAAVPSEVIQPV